MGDFEELNKYLDDASFVRWIIGKADREEILHWERWEEQHPDRTELVLRARAMITKVRNQQPTPPDSQVDLKRLLHSIDQHERKSKLRKPGRKHRRKVPLYMAIAAGLIILIGFAVFYNAFVKDNKNPVASNTLASVREFQTGFGQKSTLKLNDGSTIILNAHSNLKFIPDVRGRKDVDVWLKGEAYFTIPHLKGANKRVFRIHTSDGVITDLGTEFAVNSRSDSTSVALIEGHVRINVNEDSTNINSKGRLLKPDEVASFKKGDNGIRVHREATAPYTSWITNNLQFEHTSLRQIVGRMEETYGVEVIIKDSLLLDKKFSGSLANNNLDVLEKAIGHALKINVYQQGKKVYMGQSVK